MYKNEIVEKYAHDVEDKLVLARVLDKMDEMERKNTVTSTNFLNEHQRALAERLIRDNGNLKHVFLGGYEGASRTVLCFFPDYIEAEQIMEDNLYPLACIRSEFSKVHTLSHRDFLGSIMGAGVKRETVGDILVGQGSCDIIVVKEVVPYLTGNLESAGRAKLENMVIPMAQIQIPKTEFKTVKDTVASLRLDNIVSSGFSTSRETASEAVKSGKVFLNHLECTKADKSVSEGDIISVRGMGKIELNEVGHTTKKGRIAVIIKKYV